MGFRKIMLQAQAMLLMLLGFSAIAASPAHAEFTSTSNQNWMEQVYNGNPNFANTAIRDVILPGTHDSGTGVFTQPGFGSALAPDLINTHELGQYVVPTGVVYNQSRAQDYRVADQLNAGIRYLDLRVGPNQYFNGITFHNEETRLRTMHGIYGEDVEDILQATKNFLAANPKEVVILDFQHFHAMTDTSYAYLKDRIQFNLGNLLVPSSYGVNVTLSTLWQQNKRVIVLYGDHNYWSGTFTHETGKPIPSQFMNESWIWDRNASMHSNWMNESSAQNLRPKIEAEVNVAGNYPNQLHVLQNVVTPSIGTTINDVAGAANAIAMNGLQRDWTNKRINIVMLDFFNNCDIVNVIKTMNMKYQDSNGVDQGVYIYDQVNYQGNVNRVVGDIDNLTSFAVGNDTARSVKIVGPYQVELFVDGGYTGTKAILNSSTPDLGTTAVGKDRLSSLRVQRIGDESGVYVYENSNYGGKRVRLTGNEPNLGLTSIGNDTASSIQIVGNYRVEVFADANYQGNSYQYNFSAANLGGWNDIISSIKVYPIPPEGNGVYLYENSNYEGRFVYLTGDQPDMGTTSIGHDSVSSIRIVGPYRAVIYEHPNYQGNSFTYTTNTPSLGGWNDLTSSVKVSLIP